MQLHDGSGWFVHNFLSYDMIDSENSMLRIGKPKKNTVKRNSLVTGWLEIGAGILHELERTTSIITINTNDRHQHVSTTRPGLLSPERRRSHRHHGSHARCRPLKISCNRCCCCCSSYVAVVVVVVAVIVSVPQGTAVELRQRTHTKK